MLKRFAEGEAIPDEARLIRDEIVSEPLRSEELYSIGWPGLGPVPSRTVRYVWYEVTLDNQMTTNSGGGE